jgi:hypothetical protein
MPRGFNDYDSAAIQGRLWTPGVLRPDAWFDASDLSTITNTADGVSAWADKSGNGRTMSRVSTTYRPALRIENRNGLSAIEFADKTPAGGLDFRCDRMQMSASINVRSAYVAMTRSANPISNGSNFIFTADGEFGGGGDSYDWHGSNTDDVFADATFSSANWRNGSNFRDGASITITSAGSGPINTWACYSFLCSGNMETQGIGWDRLYHGSFGIYGEVFWFSTAHSTRERRLIEGYLSWKWGIRLAADHPFANRPPLIGD